MEKEYVIRIAESNEFWSEVVKNRRGFTARLGDDRGVLESLTYENLEDANVKFKQYIKLYEMKEWNKEKIQEINKDLSLLDIVQIFFEVGDYLEPDMDTILEEFQRITGITYQYSNLYSNVSGFLAKVEFTRNEEKVVMFVEGDDLGHLVKHIGKE